MDASQAVDVAPPQIRSSRPVVTKPDGIAALVVAVAVTACGLPLALLWWWLAPRMPVFAADDGAVLGEPQPNEYVASDLTYILICTPFAVLAAVAVWQLRRYRGPTMLVGLAVGVLGADYLAYRLGEWFGEKHIDRILESVRAGDSFTLPIVELRLTAFLFIPVIIALIVYAVPAGAHQHPDLDDDPEGTPPPLSGPPNVPPG